MSDELAQLKDDLAKLLEAAKIYDARYKGADWKATLGIIESRIARLEAEAADPWREAKIHVENWRSSTSAVTHEIINYIDHLTAERDRLAARVAELEAKPSPIDPDGYQLGDFRVMKTAQEIARYAMDRNMDHPVTVKTARRAIWAIKEFVEQARHWHGLSKLKPYRWTSIGRDDTNFIDEDFDATESPCDYDPDAHKPLGDMQPPFEGPIVGLEPILDSDRVLATAAIIYGRKGPPLSEGMCRKHSGDAKPYRVKGTDDGER